MVMVNARVYAGMTGDQRALERRSALLDAAFELVADQGWRALRIEPLCRRAGLNKRYFYESFASIDAVIEALTQRVSDQAVAATLNDIAPDATQAQAITRAVEQLVNHLTDDPRRATVLFGAMPVAEAAAAHRAQAIRRVIASAAAEGRSLNDAGDDDAVIDIAAAMLVGGTSQAVLDWLGGEIASDRAALIAALTEMWQAIGETVASATKRKPARRA